MRRLSLADFPGRSSRCCRVRIPKSFNPRSPQSRRDLAVHAARPYRLTDLGPARRAATPPPTTRVAELRARMRAHPCHGCAGPGGPRALGRAVLAAARRDRQAGRRVDARTHSIARHFDRVCDVLDELGYLDGDEVTEARPAAAAALYTELDLLAAECLRDGVWEGLSPAELAAVVSVLVYEARRVDDAGPETPGGATRDAIGRTLRCRDTLGELEARPPGEVPARAGPRASPRRPTGGPGRLESVLRGADLTAGDFVRWCKQLVDLLGQVADAAPAAAARTARGATACSRYRARRDRRRDSAASSPSSSV